MRSLITFLFVAAAAVPLAALRADDAAPALNKAAVYRLIVNDWVTVRIYGEDEVTVKSRVDAQGNITCALLDQPVHVYGLTLEQAQKEISDQYIKARIYAHPAVILSVSEYAKRIVNVTGHVKTPGQYPLDVESPTTLIDIITRAGGFDDTAKGSAVTVTRLLPDGSTKVWTFDVKGAMVGHGGSAKDSVGRFYLEPNDTVRVPQSII